MSELDNKPYGVSFVASAPEEYRPGDIVQIVADGDEKPSYIGDICTLIELFDEKDGRWRTLSSHGGSAVYGQRFFRKISVPMLCDEDSDNVKAFKVILNEMAETYKAKDSTYGNAYQDGFDRFGAVQLVSRMYEKYCRIENLLVRNSDNKVPDESVADTLTDLAVQAICLRMLLQKNDFENVV